MKEKINRKNPQYHRVRLNSLQELDRVACFLLAVSYSRRASQTTKSQQFIQIDCVATCMVNGELWVSSNSQSIISEDIDVLLEELQNTNLNVYIVKNGTPNKMHAEMQLLSQLIQEDTYCDNNYMGVSKPCCEHCAKMLNQYDINFLHYHTDEIRNWESPI